MEPSRSHRWPLLYMLLLAACWPGCAQRQSWCRVRCQPSNPLTEELALLSRRGPRVSPRTLQLTRRLDLPNPDRARPEVIIPSLQAALTQTPDAEKLYAMSEVAYLGGRRKDRVGDPQALQYYLTAAAHAYLYLFDERFGQFRNAYDPQFRGACDLYNQSLEGAMRLLSANQQLLPGRKQTIQANGQDLEMSVVLRSLTWHADDFERFEFVSDYQLKGLTNHYRTFGLGVPLIAVRKPHPGESAQEAYYPTNLSFAVTAFLRLLPCQDPQQGTSWRVLLELYDPLETSEIVVQNRFVPLETDISTPLAFFLKDRDQSRLAITGLLKPAQLLTQQQIGLHMIEPYQPDKIPVIMVHGLWSSPLAWMEMFNDLRAIPEIRKRYQFWFYLYPTGEPFLVSAARLRADLARAKAQLDPWQQHESLRHMVLVGHSMGGIVARLQTVDSGDAFWKIVSNRDFREVKGDPATLARLRAKMFFKANPDIERVVTLGTPYGGSRFANGVTQWFARKLIAVPEMMVNMQREVIETNPEVFKSKGGILTSIDMLAPNSPYLAAVRNAQTGDWVTYHNVVGDAPGFNLGEWITGHGDGVVTLDSARARDALSQVTVSADHTHIHRNPRSILEVERILSEHLKTTTAAEELAWSNALLATSPRAFDAAGPAEDLYSLEQPALAEPNLWESPGPQAAQQPGNSAGLPASTANQANRPPRSSSTAQTQVPLTLDPRSPFAPPGRSRSWNKPAAPWSGNQAQRPLSGSLR